MFKTETGFKKAVFINWNIGIWRNKGVLHIGKRTIGKYGHKTAF